MGLRMAIGVGTIALLVAACGGGGSSVQAPFEDGVLRIRRLFGASQLPPGLISPPALSSLRPREQGWTGLRWST